MKQKKKKQTTTKHINGKRKKISKKQNLHPVYIVRTMICSYFGISFFGFAKNVYLQILYMNKKKKKDENIYRKTNYEI